MYQYPNMVIIPVIHITPMQTDIIIPFIVINLSTESMDIITMDIETGDGQSHRTL